VSGSFLLARNGVPAWPITFVATLAFLGVVLDCTVALLGGPGFVESGGMWPFSLLLTAGAWHHDRRVNNELRRMVRP
jgi:hypothetical protein